jgi:peptidoglycan hydrolase-like protein with peptidoglycan-binding domain
MTRWTPVLTGTILAFVVAAAPTTAAAATGGDHDTTQRQAARADWSAGPVARWTGYARPGGSRRVREVQRTLRRLGYRPGPVDGLYGPRTARAVRRFQHAKRLRADAVVGHRTLVALRTVEAARRPVARPPAATPTPPPAALPQALPHAATPVSAPAGMPVPIAPLLAVLGAVGLAIATASYTGTRRRVLRPREVAR